MPNDRAQSSILQNIDPKKYPKLSQFLVVQSLSKDKNQAKDKETKILSNQQALELLEEAISEVEDQRSSLTATPARASRQRELDQQAVLPVSEFQAESSNLDNKSEVLATAQKEARNELEKSELKSPEQSPKQSPEQKSQLESAKSVEVTKSGESAELAELGQELAEIKEVDKEQEDKEMTIKQQAAINQLANQAQISTQPVKPVVVLPITEQQQKSAKKKSVYFSLRWLAEWAEKIKKIFAGAVLYKEEVENSADV